MTIQNQVKFSSNTHNTKVVFDYVEYNPYYYNNNSESVNGGNTSLFVEAANGTHQAAARSPIAATRANSGASAASPTGSAACVKMEHSAPSVFIG
ncbi:hypothetical protein M8J77_014614 [Diaphorina citri]|nr:hypothetical protein M8J77_014614 [Diaphorina citri]